MLSSDPSAIAPSPVPLNEAVVAPHVYRTLVTFLASVDGVVRLRDLGPPRFFLAAATKAAENTARPVLHFDIA